MGDPLGPVAVVAATFPTEIMGVPTLRVLAATTAQGVAAVRAIPGLVQNVQERMPHLVELNTPPDPADGLRWRGAPDEPESVAPVPVVPKGDYGIADRYERFLSLTGMSPDEEWLWPPATDADVAAEERALGHALPGDLAELLQVHNGECLFDSHQWLGCSDGKRMAQQSSWFNHELIVELRSNPSLAVDPGPRTLYAATNSQVGILYDMDEVPGRLLYLDVLSPAQVVPLCRDLTTLIDCYLALAEAGHIGLTPIGPVVGPSTVHWPEGVMDEVREIYVANHVAPVALQGIDGWLSRPESATFTID